jgi:rare lipoprotein A (peptidoglycan hydrolase)
MLRNAPPGTLFLVSHRRYSILALVVALAVGLAGIPAVPALAAPPAAQTATDRVAVDRAVARLDAARKRSADIAAAIAKSSADVDSMIAEEDALRQAIDARADAIYRSGDNGIIYVLFSSRSLEELTSLLDLLARLDAQDAADLNALQAARAKAQKSAKSLLALQSQEAQSVDAIAAEVAAARKTLAASTAALADYNARIARAAAPAAPRKNSPAPPPQPPQTGGTGDWLTAVASHYSPTFHGRGASGATIGPYSMMVAHKTLPFHTLIEFQYNGKRCVASVEDRGPFTPGREFDLGPGVVRALGFNGVHPIQYRIIGR